MTECGCRVMTLAKQYKQLASQALARANSEKSGEQVEWQRLSELYMRLAEQADRNARKNATDDPILGPQDRQRGTRS